MNNNETWPSCLEKELIVSRKSLALLVTELLNQLEEQLLVKDKKFDTIILSMLLGEESRETNTFLGGGLKPTVIKKNKNYFIMCSRESIGTKYMPNRNTYLNIAYSYSQLFTTIYDRI